CTAGSTAWATGSNWVGGAAPANDTTTDIARFNCTSYASLPNAGTRSVAGIIIGDGSTATSSSFAISGTGLTIGASGIDIKANTGTATLQSPVTLGSVQTWTSASSNLFTINATVNKNTNLLTIDGTGDMLLLNIVSSSGGMVKSGTGT